MLRTVKEYVDETKAVAPNHSFKGEVTGTPVQGFLDNGVLVVPYGGSANYAGEGETLELHGSGSGVPLSLTIPSYTREGILANATKMSLKFKVGALKDGAMKIALLGKDGSILAGLGFAESADGSKIIGNHYSSDLLTSFYSFCTLDNLEGRDEITLDFAYSHTTGIMTVTVGEETYTTIAGKIDGFAGIKIRTGVGEYLTDFNGLSNPSVLHPNGTKSVFTKKCG
jgi:hypothetical protein